MLTFLFNRWNTISDMTHEELARAGLDGIGLSAELPAALRNLLASISPVLLYDSGIRLDHTDWEAALNAAVHEAQSVRAGALMVSVGNVCDAGANEQRFCSRLDAAAKVCKQIGLPLFLTNRRPFVPDRPVSAAKLSRLLKSIEGVELAFDAGASHVYNRALEDFFDLYRHVHMLILSDNFARAALAPIGSYPYHPMHTPDDMLQPGYGTVPYVRLMESVRELLPDVPMFINGQRHQGASLDRVILETRALFSGKVFINPAGGKIGRDVHTDRIII